MLFGIRQHCCNRTHDITRLITLFTWILREQILKWCISIIQMFPTHVTFIVMRSPYCRFFQEVKLKPEPTCWEIDFRFRNSSFKYVTKPLLHWHCIFLATLSLNVWALNKFLWICLWSISRSVDRSVERWWQLVGIYTAVKMQHKNSTQCLLLQLILTWYFPLLYLLMMAATC